jgi:hypothetical protein
MTSQHRSVHRSARQSLVCCALILVSNAAATAVHAQARDPAAAEVLFQDGRRLMKAGQLQQACAKLEESLRLDAAVGTLANLAECEEQSGRTATAWQHWRQAVDQLGARDPRRKQALLHVAELEALLPHLQIALTGTAPSVLKIERDGVALGDASIGVALPVDPGHHVVLVTAPELWPRRYDLVISEQETRQLLVEPGEPLEPVAPPPLPALSSPRPAVAVSALAASHTPPPRRLRPLEWGLLGGAVAALGSAGYFGLRALHARGDASTVCAAQSGLTRCWSSAQPALARDRRFSLLADLGLVVGAAATASAVYLFTRPRTIDEPAVARLVAAPVPGGGEVRLAGTF